MRCLGLNKENILDLQGGVEIYRFIDGFYFFSDKVQKLEPEDFKNLNFRFMNKGNTSEFQTLKKNFRLFELF